MSTLRIPTAKDTKAGKSLLYELALSLRRQVAGLSDEELGLAAHAAEMLSSSNCWWFTYQLRGAFREAVLIERQGRAARSGAAKEGT